VAVVLVVDDDAAVRAVVRDVLEAALPVRVEEARDGYEAILWLREARADLVLLDLRMPRIDGWGVLHWLKSSRRTARIPVVALTALDFAGTLRGVERAPNGVLRKPFDIASLLSIVTATLAAAPAAADPAGMAPAQGQYGSLKELTRSARAPPTSHSERPK
jgi:CheY-like chemotaxis protein